MPEINVKVVEQLPEPLEGQIYTIEEAQVITTSVRSYKGIRVTMTDTQNRKHGTMLWLREEPGSQSKIGAFASALGSNTDAWIGKKVQFVSWRQGNRKLQVV